MVVLRSIVENIANKSCCNGQFYPPHKHCGKVGHRFDKCWQNFGKSPLYMVTQVTTTLVPPLLRAPIAMPLTAYPLITLA